MRTPSNSVTSSLSTNQLPSRTAPALVIGRIGLVRSLGRVGIPVTLARESTRVFERASRYCRGFLHLPDLDRNPDEAVSMLERFGRRQAEKPVAFFNGEADVLLFSRNRERLLPYFRILLPEKGLLEKLIDKSRFATLSEELGLPTPKTVVPMTPEDCFEAAEQVGYPCIIKPFRQRRWHTDEFIARLGLTKAILVRDAEHMHNLLLLLPPIDGREMIQQYIPGADSEHYDFHAYVRSDHQVRGSLVGHKLRTYPIHFGQGCYTRYVDDPEVEQTCLDALQRLGYWGIANINVKRHAQTGQVYILEINPRYSMWCGLDAACGVNLPLLHYADVTGQELPDQRPDGRPRRWLWVGNDARAALDYRRCGELTIGQWLRSYLSQRGSVVFQVYAWDDPGPWFGAMWFGVTDLLRRIPGFVGRRLMRLLPKVQDTRRIGGQAPPGSAGKEAPQPSHFRSQARR